jgi:hypothetical protein
LTGRLLRHYNAAVAFVRSKVTHGYTYYYLVESRREGKKVRQKVLKYLGKEPPEGWRPRNGK